MRKTHRILLLKPRSASLNALRAFEAVARHRSFSKAADELCVTQGAVSRQVKSLETFLGTRLLHRENNELPLTDAGKLILPSLTSAFDEIDQSLKAVTGRGNVLRLQVAPTFAMRWLMPRLTSFNLTHKRVELRVTIILKYDLFDGRNFDAGIIYGDGNWPELDALLLCSEILIPVCSPRLQKGRHPIRCIDDLRYHTLLHPTADKRDWPFWLKSVGHTEKISPQEGPAFETLDLAVRAAEAGYGVSIGDLSLLGDDIEDGRLVTPLEPPMPSGRGIYFVCQRSNLRQPAIAAFRNWIKTVSVHSGSFPYDRK